MKKRLPSYSSPLSIRGSELGSASPFLPILAAFIFFFLFVGVSLWFISRSRNDSTNPVASTGSFPTAPSISPAPGVQLPSSTPPPGFPSRGPSQTPGSPSPSPFSSSPSTPSQSVQLDATNARKLVEAWLSYKKTIFSSPYDLSRLDQFVVNPGPLYSDITRSGGSVDWLRSNRASYFYNELIIEGVSDFRQFPDRAHLNVKILEDIELRTPQGVDQSKSGRKSQTWVYELKLHNGKWLVYDYRKDI